MKKLCLAFISVHLLQAEELQFQISLPVFASQPVYTSVVERVPMEQCQDVKVPINQGGNTNQTFQEKARRQRGKGRYLAETE